MLVIDDDPITRWLIRTALKKDMYVSFAPDAEHGLDKFLIFKPHILLIDIHLPGKSGIDFLSLIRKLSSDVTIVMISTNISPENVDESLSKGANAFLAKPFDREHIREYLLTEFTL